MPKEVSQVEAKRIEKEREEYLRKQIMAEQIIVVPGAPWSSKEVDFSKLRAR